MTRSPPCQCYQCTTTRAERASKRRAYTPTVRDSAWIATELGDVPHRLTPFQQGQETVRRGFERGYAGG